jgi:glycosyltransferase involved in cell wall biosynthesis
MTAANDARDRLLLLCTCGAVGGVERLVLGLSRSFSEADWDVTTVFPEGPENDALLEWTRGEGVDATVSPQLLDLAAPHTLGGMLELRRLASGHRDQIVNVHFGGGHASLKDLIALRAARPRRIVASIHHPSPWDESGARKRRITRLASRLVDSIVVNSRATADLLRDAGVSDSKLRLIAPGVRPPDQLLDRAEARAQLEIPRDAFVVSSLARLRDYKGLDALIEAVAMLPPEGPPAQLVIAGEGPDRARLEQLAARLLPGRARLLGRVEDPNVLYAASDVFALPSELEGFGIVYVESAFHGVPSVGGRVGGVPDAIDDGRTGLLVPPRDAPTLAEAIERLRRDPALRCALGRAARDRAHAEFSEQQMADRYAELFAP